MGTAGTLWTYRVRVVRRLAVAVASGMLLAILPAVSAAAAGGQTWVVHPDESIQAAVDHARSGDTIKIEAGTYTEAVHSAQGLDGRRSGP